MAWRLGVLAAALGIACPAFAQEVAPSAGRIRELCDATASIASAVEKSESIKTALIDAIAAAKKRYEPARQTFVDCIEGKRSEGCEAAFDGQMEAELAADREVLDDLEATLRGMESELARFAELRASIAELIGTGRCEP
jgi:hypothetical protein